MASIITAQEDAMFLERSFRDLGDGEQWRWLRLSTVRRIRHLWKVRNTDKGSHPYVTAGVCRSFIREELACLREYRANPERELS